MKRKMIHWPILIVSMALLIGGPAQSSTLSLLTDIKVLYIYDEPQKIDWALIYYLGVENGCHVDMATCKSGPEFRRLLSTSEQYNLTSSRFYLTDTSATTLDSMASLLYGDYLPDIVILSDSFTSPELLALENYLKNRPYDSTAVFDIHRIYRRTETGDRQSVYLESRQYLQNHSREIAAMAAAVSENAPMPDPEDIYSVYSLIRSDIPSEKNAPTFLSGIDRFKFDLITEKYIESSIQKAALGMSRENYIAHLTGALQESGETRMKLLLDALADIKKIRQIYYYQSGNIDSLAPVARYIDRTVASVASAIFYEAGVNYNGKIIIRETAEGKKLKFRSSIGNTGSLKIKAGWVEFKPSETANTMIVDSNWAEIYPNNSLIREYTVDLNAGQLDSLNEKSMEFKGRLIYAGQEVDFQYKTGSFEKPALNLETMPDFLIVKPFPKLQIDHLVEPATLKAIIHKPTDYVGTVQLDVVAPPTIHAGAYQTEIPLIAGKEAIELRIPLVLTGSMGDQKHEVIINLSDRGKILASDIAYIRQAECEINPNRKIALLPDINGILEDILIQTGADYKVISDRFLEAGEFAYYDIVLLGHGSFRNYPSLEVARNKIKDYIEYGGTVIVFGQPDDWPDDLLPVSITPAEKRLSMADLVVREAGHGIFEKKYAVDISTLVNSTVAGYASYPAIVFPGNKIIEGSNNTALLSESQLGEGRLIYCGLPLTQMVRDLDINAIKLFSNLINYPGK